jgi:hypothetical protein
VGVGAYLLYRDKEEQLETILQTLLLEKHQSRNSLELADSESLRGFDGIMVLEPNSPV